MKVRATHTNCDCYRKGDEFEVYFCRDSGEGYIVCRDKSSGPRHYLGNHEGGPITTTSFNNIECFEVI